MIWLTWRQFRASAAAAAAALALLAIVFAATGPALADRLADDFAACTAASTGRGGACAAIGQTFFHDHRAEFLLVTGLALLVPALIGLFWGAPLISRETESGTRALAWGQSVTRVRWLAVKLGVVGGAAALTAGLATLAVTWWAHPIDTAAAGDFPRMEPLLFAARGIVPIGYAAFAFALGVASGLVARRTLPAMAVTLLVFAAVQVAMPQLVRPHLIEPVEAVIEISDRNAADFDVVRVGPDQVAVDTGDSGAWLLSSRLLDPSGQPVDAVDVPTASGPCGPQPAIDACFTEMNRLGYRLEVVYQPADHFWPLQWIETGVYAALAAALAAFCLWRVRRAC
ncbi:ABC transporter permease subunit [Glycomyces arizonensis]|uniref:ABC transporter permease subunit n=1 Tax=Glycomyces arizonensis TaxID=256035 RepID=UPI000401A3B8|nr:ABC transporter permease subunit [Glycomyces arizonensis]